MNEQKEIKIKCLNDDDYLKRITSDVSLTCKITTGSDGDGYFSKELVSKLMITMKRAGHNLTDLFIGSEDMDDIHEWADDTVIDPTTRREILQAGELGVLWNVIIHKRECLTEANKVYGFSFVDDVADAICVGIIDRS
jgi:hypothetical protein